MAGVEKEREEAKEEAQVAQLAVVVVGDAREKLEGDFARVKDALAATEEAKAVAEKARHKVESKAARLEVDQTPLLLELGVAKDEVSSLQSQASKDKEVMEEEYQKALKVIFSYGYGCCVFKHNICGDRPEVLEGMLDSANPLSPEFFLNPGCLLVQAAIEVTTTEVPLNWAAKEPVEIDAVVDHDRL